ncbi:MAG TPA: hypothetical protein VKX45_08460 [Bryobacteraceae bacterium]|nr:hypothetical protein [Bryobacteraceae bacterium]
MIEDRLARIDYALKYLPGLFRQTGHDLIYRPAQMGIHGQSVEFGQLPIHEAVAELAIEESKSDRRVLCEGGQQRVFLVSLPHRPPQFGHLTRYNGCSDNRAAAVAYG